jgi:predicted lipoprotein with Yx(FWY)xxD motif
MTQSVLRVEAGKRSRMFVSLAVAGATAAVLTAGGTTVSSASSAAGPSGSAPISATAVSSRPGAAAVTELTVRRTSLGTILTDGRGFTLYAFAADRGTRSHCTGACARAWPPLTTITSLGRIRVGRGVAKSLVGTTTRSGRLRQLTYAGRPLYRFSGDRRPTDTRGQGVTSFGARWNVLTPSGRLVR